MTIRLIGMFKELTIMSIKGIALLLCGFILLTVQANAAEVAVIPSSQIINPQEAFNMNVSIDPRGTEIAGAQIDIAFDPALIRVNSITEGDLFKQSGVDTFFNSGDIDNSGGTVINIFDAIIGSKNVSVQGTLIVINATAIGTSGTSGINLSNVKISDPYANPVALNVSNGSVWLNENINTNINNNGNSGSSGGGGGGGGGTSGENFSNIEIKEKHDRFINKNLTTSYFFKNTDPIIYVNITGNTSPGEVGVAVEVLRNTSSLVTSPPPDAIYKNINIWVGTSGFATPTNIKHAEITFRVPVSWMRSNSIDPDSLTMMHYQGAWESLPTRKISETSEWIYYEASTTRFSPHAITGKRSNSESFNQVPLTTANAKSPQMVRHVSTAGNDVMNPVNITIYLIIGVFIGIALNATLIYVIKKPKERGFFN